MLARGQVPHCNVHPVSPIKDLTCHGEQNALAAGQHIGEVVTALLPGRVDHGNHLHSPPPGGDPPKPRQTLTAVPFCEVEVVLRSPGATASSYGRTEQGGRRLAREGDDLDLSVLRDEADPVAAG